jgi:WXG100 family type VII secretion target
MLLKVKHGELKQVAKTMQTDSELCDEEIKKMEEQVKVLRTIWQGIDATQFCDHMDEYLAKMKNVPITMRNMLKVMDVANRGYEENDEAFGNELKKEAQNYDEDPAGRVGA